MLSRSARDTRIRTETTGARMASAACSGNPACRPAGGFADAVSAGLGGRPPGAPRAGNPACRPAGGFADAVSAGPGGRPPGAPRAGNPACRPAGGFAPAGRPARGPGLYDSQFEHDACGVGLVADLSGRRTHHTVAQALTVLRTLDHRGAKGSDPGTGDGAGILTQMPDTLFRASCDFELPARGRYAAGLVFLPVDPAACAAAQAGVARLAAEEGLSVLGWRDVPHDESFCGTGARATLPRLAQLFVAAPGGDAGLAL